MEIESPATTSDGKAIIGENNNIDDGNHFFKKLIHFMYFNLKIVFLSYSRYYFLWGSVTK